MISEKRRQELIELQDSLNIRFKDFELLNTALKHSSYVNENPYERENNEKLELLGDSVLAFIVNEHLYFALPNFTEGQLSKIKSIVVSEPSLAIIARDLNLGDYLLLGRGEQLSEGMKRQAILADTLEAVLGALCLDSGIDVSRDFILPHLKAEIHKIEENKHVQDYKTLLQLYTQKHFKQCPNYETISEDGPDHQKTFTVQVLVNDDIVGNGTGQSKKLAQQQAAMEALKYYKVPEEANENG